MLLPPMQQVNEEQLRLIGDLEAALNTSQRVTVHVSTPGTIQEAVELLCAGDSQVAWLPVPAYLLAQTRCSVEAHFRGLRQGMGWYRGQILVQAAAVRQARELEPLRELTDLQGASIAYTDPHSTTGYLFARVLLARAGVSPGEEILVAGDRQAALAVYNGEVDCAATYWAPLRDDGTPGDARALVVDSYPDVMEKVQILGLSEAIPYDPIVFRADLDRDTKQELVWMLNELARNEAAREALRALYGLGGLVPTNDGDYDGVREMLVLLDLSPEALLGPTVVP